jgi:transposase InsO family protein
VPLALVRRSLRRAWERWGLPRVVQVDNGSPWGSWSDLPPPLALWLIGLGLELAWIPPRRPQRNGVVERSHGVT